MFTADPEFGERSRHALRDARSRGAIIACEVVWAEIAAAFESRAQGHEALTRLGLDFSANDVITAVDAGALWRKHRRGSAGRDRIVADFLIGAHAATHADRLLTRDRGFYGARFKGLTVIDPSA
ncbi:MAG: type II toxin-antitoxin system VapC family toxin [Thermoleophilaceae bacterium]|nr:type II toxin-antitoxin system VapC family toxin [Thermoleophilaceae bacterium]